MVVQDVQEGEYTPIPDGSTPEDVVFPGEGEGISPRHLPTIRDNEYQASRDVVGLPPVDLDKLKTRPKGLNNLVKTRPGRGGGEIKYIQWTSAADVFDEVFGPGQWGVRTVKIDKTAKADPSAAGQLIWEITFWGRFWAVGLPAEHDVFGWGQYYTKDANAHYADAIESAMSRCITKMGARLAKYLRVVWGRDEKEMEHISAPNATMLNAAVMMMKQIMGKSAEKKAEVEKILASNGLTFEDIEKSQVSAAELAKVNQEVSRLL